MDNVIIVSVDSHAQPPPEVWPQYLEQRYHDYLPSLREEAVVFHDVMGLFIDRINDSRILEFDHDNAYRSGGVRGVFDLGVRLYEMDREGIAGEYIYNGDNRYPGMFYQSSNRRYPTDVCVAGMRAYHRWLYDTFGSAQDRLFLLGGVGSGPCASIEEVLEDTEWIADHGFVGTSIPGFTAYPDQPPLFDDHWEPFWSRCEERGLALWVHAGHGEMQGSIGDEVGRIYAENKALGGSHDELMQRLSSEVLSMELFSSAKPRRPMWQLMLGGVFDRHPGLKLVMNEVRADWMPATLRYLDRVYEENRADLRAKRLPSEYWQSNGLTCLSFVHKSEIELRYEIGIETLCFGRDYPHQEGTWPNTNIWLRDALEGLPEHEVRRILRENVIRTLGLDRAKLAEVAARIGPTIEEMSRGALDLAADPALLAHIDDRGGYLKPAEGDAKIVAVEAMVREDLARVAARA